MTTTTPTHAWNRVLTVLEMVGLLPLSILALVFLSVPALPLVFALASAWYVVLGRMRRILDGEPRASVALGGVAGIGSSLGLLALATLVVVTLRFILETRIQDAPPSFLGSWDTSAMLRWFPTVLGGPALNVVHRLVEATSILRHRWRRGPDGPD